jgi:multiple sugar transport system substrate-binding protein
VRLKRLTTVVVAAAAVALGLAACSGGTGEGSGGGTSSNGTVTLQFPSWQATEPGYEQFYKSQVAQFEKSHPNVKINFYEVTYDNFIQQMTTELSANDAPDILPLPVANYAAFASDGFLTNLDSDLQGTDILSSWTPGQKSMQVNGHYYGVLMQAAGYVLYANKQLLAAKHLSVPTTMTQLLADSKALTGNGTYGIAMPTAQDPNIVSYASAFIVGNGQQLLVNNKYNLTDPKVVSDIQQYRELAQYAAPGLITEQARQIYNSGKAAFLLDGIFELPAIASASKSVYASTEMLKMPTPSQVTKLSSSLQIPAGISQQHKQLAWEFIKQVTSPAAQTAFAKDTQTPAPRTAVNAAVASSIPFYSVQQASDNGLNIVPSATWFQSNYGEIGTDFGDAMTKLFTSNASASSALAGLQSQLPAPGSS